MITKKKSRLRRAAQTRIKISKLKINRLSVHRTNMHIYASVISPEAKILVSASTLEVEVRQQLIDQFNKSNNIAAAMLIGKRVAKKAFEIGVTQVAFDRSGFHYHGRIKALAEAAREVGLKF